MGRHDGIKASAWPLTAAAITAGIGIIVLAGWATGLPPLTGFVPGLVAMQPWTAAGLVLGALALGAAAGGAARLSALAALGLTVMAALPLAQYATGLDLGTDRLFFPRAVVGAQTHPLAHPGRTSMVAALGMMAVGLALLLARGRPGGLARRIVMPVLALSALALPGLTLVAFVAGLDPMSAAFMGHPVAVHTAAALALLALGTLGLTRGDAPRPLAMLLLGLVLAGLLPALAVGIAATWQAAESRRAALELRLRDTGRALALAVDAEIGAHRLALQALAANPALDAGAATPREAAEALLRPAAAALGFGITLSAPDGRMIANTLVAPDAPLPAIQHMEVVRRAIATGTPQVVDLSPGLTQATPASGLVVPVLRGGQALAILGLRIEPERFRALLAAQGLPEGSLAALTDSRHVVVARSDALHAEIMGRTVAEENRRILAAGQPGVFRTMSLDGIARTWTFQPLRNAAGWHVVMLDRRAMERAEVEAAVGGVLRGGLLALLAGAALALLAAWRILQPLRALEAHARAVAAGRGHPSPLAAAFLPPVPVKELETLRQGFAAAEAALRDRASALAKSEERFRLAAAATGGMIYDYDPRQDRITRIGDLEPILGFRLEEVAPTRDGWLALLHPDDLGAYQAAAATVYQGDADHFEVEYRARHRDGHWVHLWQRALARRDGAGRVLRVVGHAISIDRLKRAEAAALESAARLRTLTDAVPALVWVCDGDGRALSLNGRWHDYTGLTPDASAGFGWAAALHRDDAPTLMAAWRQAQAKGTVCEGEARYRRAADGTWRWHAYRTVPVRGPDGRVVAWYGCGFDIEDGKRAEAALREREERLRLALQAAALGIVEWDLPEGALRADVGAEAITRGVLPSARPLSLAGPERPDWRARMHPEDRPRRTALREALLAGVRDTAQEEYRIRLPGSAEGEWTWLSVRSAVVAWDDAGRPTRILDLMQDVTAQRETEAALAEGEARFRAMADNIPQLAWMAKPDGALFWYNRRWFDYTGTTAEAMLGWGWRAVHHPDHLERVEARFRQCVEAGEPWEDTFPLRGQDGGWRWFLSRAEPIRGPDGRVTLWFGTNTDVTEAREAEEALRRHREELEQLVEARTAALQRAAAERQQAEEAMRQGEQLAALGRLTGGVAHDFNNLLQVVTSGATMLRRADLPEPRRERVLDALVEAGNKARDLTAQLLAFARRQALKPEDFDLNARIRGMAELLRRTLGSRIRVAIDLDEALWPVHADPGQLEIALINLAANARDAMPAGGQLTLRSRNATLEAAGERAAGDFVRLDIEDTGTGMEPAVLARVFEPFFTTKENGKGTGLGLAQVFGFARQSGGDLLAESEPGRGTRITLLLRRAASLPGAPVGPPATREDAVVAALRASAGKTVLVVEDNLEAGEFAAHLLEGLGFRTRRAGDVAGALAVLAEDGAVDAVFSDVVMPGGRTGLDLAAQLRATHPAIAVVLTSGYSARLAEGERPDGVEVLGKPYRLEELAAALLRALARAADRARLAETVV